MNRKLFILPLGRNSPPPAPLDMYELAGPSPLKLICDMCTYGVYLDCFLITILHFAHLAHERRSQTSRQACGKREWNCGLWEFMTILCSPNKPSRQPRRQTEGQGWDRDWEIHLSLRYTRWQAGGQREWKGRYRKGEVLLSLR